MRNGLGGWGKGYLSWRDTGLSQDREGTDMAHGHMTVNKDKVGNSMLG